RMVHAPFDGPIPRTSPSYRGSTAPGMTGEMIPSTGRMGKGGVEGAGIFKEDPRRDESAAGPVRVAGREVRPDHATHRGLGQFRLSRDRRYRRLRLTATTVIRAASPARRVWHGTDGPDSLWRQGLPPRTVRPGHARGGG